MKSIIYLLCFFLLFIFQFSYCSFLTNWEPCAGSQQIGLNCTLNVTDPFGTQFTLGMAEVDCKRGYIESATYKDLVKYMTREDMIVPLVVGPDGYYMINGHHLVRALLDADVDPSWKTLFCNIVDDLSEYTNKDVFWMEMVNRNYTWLYDSAGRAPLDPQYIPYTVELLVNDPYRSLAWMSRNNGAYGKTAVPFADFMWANYYRSKIQLNETTDSSLEEKVIVNNYPTSWRFCDVRPYSPLCFDDQLDSLQEALPFAIKMASLPDAEGLPGYLKGISGPADCGHNSTLFFDTI